MRYIDINTWSRKQHYQFFSKFDYPHFNITTNIDITGLYNYCKSNEISIFKAIVYSSIYSINNISELKQRIRPEGIIEHDIIHPSFTVIKDDNTFRFSVVQYNENFNIFIKDIEKAIENTKMKDDLGLEPDLDNLVYMSCLPWISFTGVTHPINMHPVDSIPRLTWGKYFMENNLYKMPYSIQVNHALADGIHVSMFYNSMQEIMNNPQDYFIST